MTTREWIETTVGEIASVERNGLVGGPFGSNLVSRDYVKAGVPVIRSLNMGQGRWVGGDFAFVPELKARQLAANVAHPMDIVFMQRGTLRQVAVVPSEPFDKYIVSQSQGKLTVEPSKADPLFVYYVFLVHRFNTTWLRMPSRRGCLIQILAFFTTDRSASPPE